MSPPHSPPSSPSFEVDESLSKLELSLDKSEDIELLPSSELSDNEEDESVSELELEPSLELGDNEEIIEDMKEDEELLDSSGGQRNPAQAKGQGGNDDLDESVTLQSTSQGRNFPPPQSFTQVGHSSSQPTDKPK